MLKVKDIKLAPEKYGTAYECVVTFQVGDQSYSTVTTKLTPEATREIVDLAVARASAMLVVTASDIAVAGEPLPTIDEEPEFAEAEPLIEPAAPPEWMQPLAPEPQPEEQF